VEFGKSIPGWTQRPRVVNPGRYSSWTVAVRLPAQGCRCGRFDAFVAGLSRGSLVCAGVVALGAVFAFLVLPRRLPDTPPSPPVAPGSKPGQTG
jgi:hypothetical protein